MEVLGVEIDKVGFCSGELIAQVVDGSGGATVAVTVIAFEPVMLVIDCAVAVNQGQALAVGGAVIDIIKDFGGFIVGG